MKKIFPIRLLIVLISLSFLIYIPSSSSVPARKTILWYQYNYGNGYPNYDLPTVAEWAIATSFNSIAYYGDLTTEQIDYLHGLGLQVFAITIPYMLTYVTNWTAWWTELKLNLEAKPFDGVVVDDTQNIWYMSQVVNTSIPDHIYYQQFLSNATIVSDEFGPENTIIEMGVFSDNGNYDEMTTMNSSVTFSYYYPPDPAIRYWGIYNNMTANAWNITDQYVRYGLNSYYAYQGWLWLEGDWSSYRISTETLMKTYNAVVDLSGNYTTYDLFIYNFHRNYGNPRTEMFIKEINDAWLADQKLSEERITLQDFATKYWHEPFEQGIANQSSVTDEGWLINRVQPNYTWSTATNELSIGFDGTNNMGYYGITFSRAISCSEEGQFISYQITPDSYLSWKQIVLQGSYPYPNAYFFQFGYGEGRPFYFGYRNATTQDVAVDLGTWSSNSTYTVNATLEETYAYMKIQNSTWQWNTTIQGDTLAWTSIKLNAILIQDYTGNWATETTFHSMDIEYINLNPVSSRNYVTIAQWETNNYITGQAHKNFEAYYGGSTSPPEKNVTTLDISTSGFRFNITSGTGFYLQWYLQEYVPFQFVLGMIGLVALFGSPIYGIYAIRKRSREDIITALIMGCIGFGLFLAWLWGV